MATDKKISELPVISAVAATDVSVLVHNGADYQFDFTTLLQFINSGINPGASISFGTSLPQNTTGKNGDIFINTTAGSFAQKQSGAWLVKYTLPINNGTDGTVLYGSGIPGAGIGNNNDTYINIDTGIFHHKAAGTWTQVFSMQTGPQGPKGDKGDTGVTGAKGKTILSGTSNPSNSTTGTNGDLYLNTNTYQLFGPKTAGVWGSGTSIMGLTGEQGDPGPTGTPGAGVVTGGTTGQVLSKVSDADFDTEWVDATVGDGASGLTPKQLLFGARDGTLEQNAGLVFAPDTNTLLLKTSSVERNGNIYFLGDSISFGTGAPTGSKKFSSLIASSLELTEVNRGNSGATVQGLNLSDIPVKSADDRLLMFEYGTNDAGSVATTAFEISYRAVIENALGKGWLGSDICLLSITGATYSSVNDALYRSFNAIIEGLADTYDLHFADVYDGLLNQEDYAYVTYDGIHPNAIGHYIISLLVMAALSPVVTVTDQSFVVAGKSDFEGIRHRDYRILNSADSNLIGKDAQGNVGIILGLKDGFILGKTIIAGNLIQKGAALPDTYADKTDILLKNGTKIISAFNGTRYNSIAVSEAACQMSFRSLYSGGRISFMLSNGVDGGENEAFSIEADMTVSAKRNFVMRQGYKIEAQLSGTIFGRIVLLSSTGDMIFTIPYVTGSYQWEVGNGNSDGTAITAMFLNQYGRLQLQIGGTITDIPSAKLALNSTTEGFLMPRMTATQRDAISSPAEGLEIYNLTTHTKNFYNGTDWRQVSDTPA